MSKITNDCFNPVWHRMLYSCTHMATVDVKGLSQNQKKRRLQCRQPVKPSPRDAEKPLFVVRVFRAPAETASLSPSNVQLGPARVAVWRHADVIGDHRDVIDVDLDVDGRRQGVGHWRQRWTVLHGWRWMQLERMERGGIHALRVTSEHVSFYI